MKNLKRLNLITALAALLAVLSLHQSSSAQAVFGTWNGSASYDVKITPQGFGQPTQEYTGTVPSLFTIQTVDEGGVPPNDVAISVTIPPIPGIGNMITAFGPTFPTNPFGPTSATAVLGREDTPPVVQSGDFSLTYESIAPNGVINVGNGTAIAQLNWEDFAYFNPVTGLNEHVVESATFNSPSIVPEPASIVMAASGALLVLACAFVRAVKRLGRRRLA
jgi:hypothetical protein